MATHGTHMSHQLWVPVTPLNGRAAKEKCAGEDGVRNLLGDDSSWFMKAEHGSRTRQNRQAICSHGLQMQSGGWCLDLAPSFARVRALKVLRALGLMER